MAPSLGTFRFLIFIFLKHLLPEFAKNFPGRILRDAAKTHKSTDQLSSLSSAARSSWSSSQKEGNSLSVRLELQGLMGRVVSLPFRFYREPLPNNYPHVALQLPRSTETVSLFLIRAMEPSRKVQKAALGFFVLGLHLAHFAVGNPWLIRGAGVQKIQRSCDMFPASPSHTHNSPSCIGPSTSIYYVDWNQNEILWDPSASRKAAIREIQ